jgi:hypothetical protein
MADLFHLLDELNEPQEEENEQDVVVEAQDEVAAAAEEEVVVEDNDDREIIALPAGLGQPTTTAPSTYGEEESDQKNTIYDRLDLQDFAGRGGGGRHYDEDEYPEDAYQQLQYWWVQELQAPELLPWNADIMEAMIDAAFEEDEGPADTGNLEAILCDIRKVDQERVQFLVANLLQARLHKIQACPSFYRHHHPDHLSPEEVSFLCFALGGGVSKYGLP